MYLNHDYCRSPAKFNTYFVLTGAGTTNCSADACCDVCPPNQGIYKNTGDDENLCIDISTRTIPE